MPSPTVIPALDPLPIPGRPWLPCLALPLVLGAGGLVGGGWWWLALIAAPLAVLTDRRWPFAARALIGLAALVSGGWLALPPAVPCPDQRVLALTGTALSVATFSGSQGIVVEPTTTDDPGGYLPRRIFVRGAPLPAILPGDMVAARGAWSRDARGDRLHAQSIERLVRREDGSRGFAWRSLARIGAHGDLAGALLLGLGNPPEKELFLRTGLIHVLAVSGVHLALAAAMGTWLLFRLGLPWLWRQVALGVLLIGYTWLTAASPATVRALAMALAYTAYGLLAREPHRLGPVSLAALGLILWDPGMAHDLGFQLSLLAVLGIMTLGMDLMQLRARLLPLAAWPLDRPLWRMGLFAVRSTSDGLLIGTAATLAIAPLLVGAFGNLAPWSVLTTLLVSPPTTLALWTGLPLIGLAGLWPDGPWEGLYQIVDGALWALVAAVQVADLLPGRMAVSWPPIAAILLWPLIFLPCEPPWQRTGGPSPVPWATLVRVAIACILGGWWLLT